MWSHQSMKTSSLHPSTLLHPFGGCNRLLEHYRQIGKSLLDYEVRISGSLMPGRRYNREFGQAVVFVPVEVLESYLDDLLDVEVQDESLFIKKPRPAKRALLLAAVGLCTLVASFYAGREGGSFVSLTVLLAITVFAGMGGALYFLPRLKILRRFSFATLLSGEIARRRGHDKTNVGGFATRLLMRDLWTRGEQGSTLPPHPARSAVRYYH